MKTFLIAVITTLFSNNALAMEGVKASCTESVKHGNRKGTYSLPIAYLQTGDSFTLGSLVHVADRYLLTVIPPLSDLIQNAPTTEGVGDPGTYEVLLTQLPTHEKQLPTSEKVCHASSILLSAGEQKSITLKYSKKDDIGGFFPHEVELRCDLVITKI